MMNNMTIFNTVMDNMKQIGCKYFASIPMELLTVDPEYQRIESRSQDKINQLAATWDVNKLDPLIVVPHPEDACFSIVDGYGRYCASQMLDVPYVSIPCNILMDAPEEPYERRMFEARIFANQCVARETLRPIQLHKARLLLGDKGATVLQDVCDTFGLKIDASQKGKGKRKSTTICNYGDLYKIAKQEGGREQLEFIFKFEEAAGWTEESDAYARYIIDSISICYNAHLKCKNNILMIAGKEIRKMSPDLFRSNAVSKYPSRSVRAACILYLEDIMVEAGFYRAVFFDEGKVKVIA